MSHRPFAAVVIAAGVCAMGVVAAGAGQQALPRGTSVARLGERVRVVATNTRATSVMGFAWSASNEPLPNVQVQLRSVLSGTVEAQSRTSDAGEFLFGDIEGGTYVVELVNDSGRVVALGAPFTVAPGETVATFVRLALPAPWFTGVMTNAAAAAVSSAAGIGVVAVTPQAQDASPDR